MNRPDLPLLLLAVMMAIGAVIEPLFFDTLLWPGKLALLSLLVIYWARKPKSEI
ncbi:MAG: hypothetical protein AAGD38_18815 [Acidobacteriota bacterium]